MEDTMRSFKYFDEDKPNMEDQEIKIRGLEDMIETQNFENFGQFMKKENDEKLDF